MRDAARNDALEEALPAELPAALEERLSARLVASRRAEFVTVAATGLAIAFAAIGGAGLLARRWFAASDVVLAIAWGIAIGSVLLISAVLARRRCPSVATELARLDRDAGGTGRLLTRAERSDPRYDDALEHVLALAPAPVSPPWSRSAKRVVPWLMFAIVPFLLAPGRFASGSLPIAAIEPTLARIEEKLATLEEEIALDDAGEADLAERVERTQDAAQRAIEDGSLETALEALDRMERELTSAAERAARAIERAAEDAADASLAADAEAAQALADVESDLAAAGLASAMAQAREDVAEAQREERETSEDSAGDEGAEHGEANSEAGASANAALSAALMNRLGQKAGALANAGLLKPIDRDLAAKLEKLARKLKQARDAKESATGELAELEEIDLCDEEQHGPG